MKKSESLVATLLAIYGVILTLCIAIYAIFKLLNVDITLATNLLLWSAAIFAPMAVFLTYSSWKEQKSAEIFSQYSDEVYKEFIAYSKILEKYSISWPKNKQAIGITKELEEHFDKIYPTLILYCDFLRSLKIDQVGNFNILEREHYKLLQIMEAMNEEENMQKWCEISSHYSFQFKRLTEILHILNKNLVKSILFQG